MNNTDFRLAYDYLVKIFKDDAYLHIVMKENSNKRVKKIVCGVIEKYYELNYIVGQLAENGVKNNLKPILFIAVYVVKYMNTPLNAVINETTETLNGLGKGAVKKFAEAVIRKAANDEYDMPKKSDKNYVEVKYNLPSWVVGMYKKDYPDNYEEIINAKEFPLVHIRLNKNTLEEDVLKADKDAVKTEVGYFVKKNKEIDLLSFLGKITYMSYGSALIASSIEANTGMKILDCCAAPGGKAVALAQSGAEVIACDVHDHRVDLIRSYAERMRTGVTAYRQDATEFVHKWNEYFDVVLADVPCSGFGVIGKKRDVVFNRTYDDVKELAELQLKILNNVCKYVKKGGLLVYSTCTVFRMENGNNVERFLSEHGEFKKEKINLPFRNEGEIQFLPDGKGMEGFYLCHMRKE